MKKPMEVIRYVPGFGFSMAEMSLRLAGRDDIFSDITSPEQLAAADYPIFAVPSQGIWYFSFNGTKEEGGYSLIERGLAAIGDRRDFHVCLDCAGEGVAFTTDLHDHLEKRFREFRLHRTKLYFLTSRFDAEVYYQQWCLENNRSPILTPLYSPIQMYYMAGQYGQKFTYQVVSEHVGRCSPDTSELRKKKFLCLNLSPRPSRWATVLHMLDSNFLSDGLVSFYGRHVDNGPFDQPPSLDEVKASLARLKLPSDTIALVEKLDAMTPLVLDDPSASRLDKAYAPSFADFYSDTYFSVVTESDFEADYGPRFTEKVLKPFANFHPFIHIGPAGVLSELRRLGFQTFSPYIDESYDEIENPAERLHAALSCFDDLARKSREELHRLYGLLWPRLTHNFLWLTCGSRSMVDHDRGIKILRGI